MRAHICLVICVLCAACSPGVKDFTLEHKVRVRYAEWSPDASRLLTISDSSANCVKPCTFELNIWDAHTGTNLLTIRRDSYIIGAQWSRNATHVLFWSWDGTARVWDIQADRNILTIYHTDMDLYGNRFAVSGAAWSPDETRILTWSGDNEALRIWDAKVDGEQSQPLASIDTVYTNQHALWNQTGTQILTCTGKVFKIWDVGTGTALHTYPNNLSDQCQKGFWDLKEAWILGQYGVIWDVTTGSVVNDTEVTDASWCPGSSVYITVSSGTLSRWNAGEGEAQLKVEIDRSQRAGFRGFRGVRCSPQGGRVLTWAVNGDVDIWDTSSLSLIQTLQHHLTVSYAAWSPDSSRVLIITNSPVDDSGRCTAKDCRFQVQVHSVAGKR